MVMAKSIELLFTELNSINWRRSPYRGIMKRVGEKHFPNKRQPAARANRAFKQLRNLEIAIDLKRELNELEQKVQEVTNNG